MEYHKILYSVEDNIARITLNEPEKRNSISMDMMKEIIDALNTAEGDGDVRVVIITGAGKAFCAGANLGAAGDIRGVAGIKEGAQLHISMIERFLSLGKPSIAMVNGYALAGGCGLAMYPTFAIAADTAKFGLTEVNVGLWSMMVSGMLMRMVPRRKALELLCLGERIDAYEAERIGLINKVVPADELEAAVTELAEKLKSKSPMTLKLGLEAFNKASDLQFSKAEAMLADMWAILCTTEDAVEGITAFLEKRKPVWHNR